MHDARNNVTDFGFVNIFSQNGEGKGLLRLLHGVEFLGIWRKNEQNLLTYLL
jgi:hypothetical protein